MTDEELLVDAESAYNYARDYPRAASQFKELVSRGHREANTFLMLAFCEASVTKDASASDRWLSEAARAGAREDEIVACRSAIEWAGGRIENATKLAKEAARQNPSVENLNTLFAILQDVSTSDAEVLAQEMIRRYPLKAEGFACMGSLAFQQSRYDEAIRHIERALELEPDDLHTLAGLGDAYYGLGDYAKARKCFEELLNYEYLDRHCGLYLLGMCYYKGNNDKKEARRCFEEALTECPDYEEAKQALDELEREGDEDDGHSQAK